MSLKQIMKELKTKSFKYHTYAKDDGILANLLNGCQWTPNVCINKSKENYIAISGICMNL